MGALQWLMKHGPKSQGKAERVRGMLECMDWGSDVMALGTLCPKENLIHLLSTRVWSRVCLKRDSERKFDFLVIFDCQISIWGILGKILAEGWFYPVTTTKFWVYPSGAQGVIPIRPPHLYLGVLYRWTKFVMRPGAVWFREEADMWNSTWICAWSELE